MKRPSPRRKVNGANLLASGNKGLVRRLEKLPASVVYDALRKLGIDNPILPHRIVNLTRPAKIAGRIFTVSGREVPGLDRDKSLRAWATLLSEIPPDCVVVCQPRTHAIALMGELSAKALKIKGVRGYVVDGACRDIELVERVGLSVFGTHATPADITGRWLPDRRRGRVVIGHCTVRDGDFLVADKDGVVVIPSHLAANAIAEAEAMNGVESGMRKAISSGIDPLKAYLKHGKF
jgi:4-hydroxy-4-methyl-2-oxoglutarate aldolase